MENKLPIPKDFTNVLCECGHRFGLHDLGNGLVCLRGHSERSPRCLVFRPDNLHLVEWIDLIKKSGKWDEYKDFYSVFL